VAEEFGLIGLDFHASGFDCLLNVSIGENHNGGRTCPPKREARRRVIGYGDYHAGIARENRKIATDFQRRQESFVVYFATPCPLKRSTSGRKQER
jgi:hypothetical protein